MWGGEGRGGHCNLKKTKLTILFWQQSYISIHRVIIKSELIKIYI